MTPIQFWESGKNSFLAHKTFFDFCAPSWSSKLILYSEGSKYLKAIKEHATNLVPDPNPTGMWQIQPILVPISFGIFLMVHACLDSEEDQNKEGLRC